MDISDLLSRPWPWYLAGPLIGLMVPLLLILGNKMFGMSSTLRQICAACFPGRIAFFHYDWKKEKWNLVLAAGIVLGGVLGGIVFRNPEPVRISAATVADLEAVGIATQVGLHPAELFSFSPLLTLKGFIFVVVGGFLVGFGTRYAGGCTSGHSIMGMSNLQWPSMIATGCFFAGGLLMTWVFLPGLLGL